jgi:hypothetical protein
MTYQVDAILLEDLKRLEHEIATTERPSILARWHSGRKIAALYAPHRKQLPNGLLDAIAAELGVVRSEIGFRVKFAKKFPTESEVSTVVESCRSWTAIRQWALTDTPRQKSNTSDPLHRAFKLVEAIDAETRDERDLRLIANFIDYLTRLSSSIATLRAA